MKTPLNSNIRSDGCASPLPTNCGRKAKKKMVSFGLRMLMRIAEVMTPSAGLAAVSSTVSALLSRAMRQAVKSTYATPRYLSA